MNFAAQNPSTFCLTRSALAAGTTTTLNAAASTYSIRGKMYAAGALTNGAAPTLDANTGKAFAPISANQGTVVVVGLNAAGTTRAYQGSIEKVDAFGNFVNSPQYTAVPDDFCPIGLLAVKAASTVTVPWQFAVNNNSAVTGITYAFTSLCTIPDRPLVP